MKLIDSDHSKLLGRAMDAMTLRQRITAANVANADTPGYRRHQVNFEDELRRVQDSGNSRAMRDVTASIEETDQPVVLEDELMEMADTQIRVHMLTRSLRHHFDLMRIGVTGNNR
ncbi:MAG: flagellar biosynthesis protein FlgB [Bacteroidetes bacterium]|nr:flagellar biosynthesis protein FlgB [Bacteroidota bacterium]MCH8523839.1 flagellar basal body protein [Balneolales bacterium]